MTQSVEATLDERGARYGDFKANAGISQQFKLLLYREYSTAHSTTCREALEMIVQKIARILNGDPEYKDNWHDIAGYAMLAEERCTPADEGEK